MLWLAGSVAVHYLPTAKAASPASRIYLGAGAIRRSLGPGTSNPFYRTPFDPDQNIHGRPNAKRLPEDLTARDDCPFSTAIATAVVRNQSNFSLARGVTRAPEHGERSLGAQCAADATQTISTSASKPGSFNWMSILRQMPYFDLTHSDFFFTPARGLFRRGG